MMLSKSKLALLTAIIALTLACGAGADGGLNAGDGLSDKPLTFSRLKDFIEKNDIRDIESLIKGLSQLNEYRNFSKQFVLMKHSRSMQRKEVSPDFPRIIMYQDYLLFGMTGDPSGEHFNTLEIIEFDPTSTRFQFRKIEFPRTVEQQPRFISDQSHPELKRCTDCHGSENPRPNWDYYPDWPGAYGANHNDELSTDAEDYFKFHRAVTGKLPSGDAQDWKEYEKLRTTLGNAPALPAATHQRYRELDFTYLTVGSSGQFDFEPNELLQEHIEQTNADRIVNEIVSHPRWDRFKYSLIAALQLSCPNLPSLIPTDILKSYEDTLLKNSPALKERVAGFPKSGFMRNLQEITFEQFKKDSTTPRLRRLKLQGLKSEWDESRKRFTAYRFNSEPPQNIQMIDNEAEFLNYNTHTLSRMRLILEGEGVEMKWWSTSFQPGGFSYHFDGLELSYSELRDRLLKRIFVSPEEIRELEANSEQDEVDCDFLKEKSLGAFNKEQSLRRRSPSH